MRRLIIAMAAGLIAAPLIALAQAPAPNEGRQQAGPALKIDTDVEYAKAGGQALKLDLYRVLPSTEPLPVVVWIHGADGALATKTATPAGALARANAFAVASIDYRANATRADQLADVKAAIRFLRTNAATYGLNGEKIAVFGHDVGGQLAALAGTTADVPALNAGGDARVQAVVNVAGPVTTGGLDPSTYVSEGDAPTLIFHGSADTKVSTLESQKLIAALKKTGINATLDMPFGVGHDVGDLLSPVAMQTITTFLNNHLKGQTSQAGLSAFTSTPARTYIDPVALDLGGTRYGLYPSPARGPNTFASYRIYLPQGYEANPARRYPVIYFLHGRSVDSKRPITSFYISRADAAMRTGVMPQAIIVLVQGDNNGWYMDSQDKKFPMESILIKNLIPFIDANYRTIATREARAVEGHSMGGFGALHIGLKYPDLFATVTGNSPAMIDAPTDGMGDQKYWDTQKPLTLAKANLAKVKTQKVRIIIGDKDGLFAGAKAFSEQLTALGVTHEFHPVINSPHNHDQLLQYETFDTMAFYAGAFGR